MPEAFFRVIEPRKLPKSILGIPVSWNHRKAFWNLWNIHEDKIFLPKHFGIGWDVNFYALLKRARLIRSSRNED